MSVGVRRRSNPSRLHHAAIRRVYACISSTERM
jgi:hypothetical protein